MTLRVTVEVVPHGDESQKRVLGVDQEGPEMTPLLKPLEAASALNISPRKRPGTCRIPAPEMVTPTTPLRLEVAARLAFPDGSMTVSALRRLVVGGKLDHEFIAGKYYVTLAAIEEMRSKCRVQAKAQDLSCKPEKVAAQSGSSETVNETSALDAMNATARALRENLRTTSSPNTT